MVDIKNTIKEIQNSLNIEKEAINPQAVNYMFNNACGAVDDNYPLDMIVGMVSMAIVVALANELDVSKKAALLCCSLTKISDLNN